MTIVVTNLGTSNAAQPSLPTITIGAAGVPPNVLIFVATSEDDGTTGSESVTDTKSNTYTKIQELANGTTLFGSQFYAKNSIQLNQNDTISYHFSAVSGQSASSTFCYATGIDTANPLDTNSTKSASGSSTSPSVTSNTSPSQSGELFIGTVHNTGASMNDAFVQASGWAAPPNDLFVASKMQVAGGNQVNSIASQLTYNPTINNTAWVALICSFKSAQATEEYTLQIVRPRLSAAWLWTMLLSLLP